MRARWRPPATGAAAASELLWIAAGSFPSNQQSPCGSMPAAGGAHDAHAEAGGAAHADEGCRRGWVGQRRWLPSLLFFFITSRPQGSEKPRVAGQVAPRLGVPSPSWLLSTHALQTLCPLRLRLARWALLWTRLWQLSRMRRGRSRPRRTLTSSGALCWRGRARWAARVRARAVQLWPQPSQRLPLLVCAALPAAPFASEFRVRRRLPSGERSPRTRPLCPVSPTQCAARCLPTSHWSASLLPAWPACCTWGRPPPTLHHSWRQRPGPWAL